MSEKQIKVWVEIEVADTDEENNRRAKLLSKVLKKAGVKYDEPVFWNSNQRSFSFTNSEAGTYVDAEDNGHWYDLEYLAKDEPKEPGPREILVTSNHGYWARGENDAEAIQRLCELDSGVCNDGYVFNVSEVPHGTRVNQLGSTVWKAIDDPDEIRQKSIATFNVDDHPAIKKVLRRYREAQDDLCCVFDGILANIQP